MLNQLVGRGYETVARPLLFCLPPEAAHLVGVHALRFAGFLPGLNRLSKQVFDLDADELSSEVAGIRFHNPIGLAAGWDKNGIALRMLDHLGFGFTEVGSISAHPSVGNPKPRLFRVPSDRAIVVNYGLPNDGAEVVARRLMNARPKVPRGVNVVSTNRGPVSTNRGPHACPSTADEIFDDYHHSVSVVHEHATYLTLNLSCPNAQDGKDFFTEAGNLRELLSRLAEVPIRVPVFLKMPPTDSPREHDRWLSECDPFPFVRGFLFNLAPGRPDYLRLQTDCGSMPDLASMPGAIAGAPVRERHNQCIASLYSRMDRNRYVIIGGGGVLNADDAWEKVQLGASLVQIYTALIYKGPSVTQRINEGLLCKLHEHGFKNIAEAVGTKGS